MSVESSKWNPLSYFVIFSSFTFCIVAMFGGTVEEERSLPDFLDALLFYGIALLLLLIAIAMTQHVPVGIFHLWMRLPRFEGVDYSTTFRILCYAEGTRSLLALLSVGHSIFSSLANLWLIVLLVIAFRELCSLTTRRALIASFPLLVQFVWVRF